MSVRSRIRGPKLRTKLVLIALFVLVFPLLSYLLLVEMERLLVQSQKNALITMAGSVAMVFNNQSDLFGDLPSEVEETRHLYAPGIDGNVRLDGNRFDWSTAVDISKRLFGSGDGSFSLALGEQINLLYGLVEVNDAPPVYRETDTTTLNTSDHLRIRYTKPENQSEQLAFTFSNPGIATVYLLDQNSDVSGSLVGDEYVRAFLIEKPEGDGYSIEFQLPLNRLHGPPYKDFEIEFVDVDDTETRAIESRISTTSEPEGSLELVVVRSAQIIELIETAVDVDGRIEIYDDAGRLRGTTGVEVVETPEGDSPNNQPNSSGRGVGSWRNFYIGEAFRNLRPEDAYTITESVIDSAQRGNPTAQQNLSPSNAPVIIAAYPIRTRLNTSGVLQDTILGVAVVEQNVEDILAFQQRALQQMLLLSLLALLVVVIVLFGYSIRLAFRIQRLRGATSRAIDEYGRLKVSSLTVETGAGDEIGDLARAVDGMLGRLNQHQMFLQRMPRTLRHEINNPLNTLSTSLENLRNTNDPNEQNRYIESARKGVFRIGRIVQNLSDAASLEDSLRNETFERVDLLELLSNYVSNLHSSRPQVKIAFLHDEQPTIAYVSDIHIEQMLDKVIDNAIDFHRHDSPISIQLVKGKTHLRIAVANRGPTLRSDPTSIFDSLVSHRATKSRMHFGLGLYVVRAIAEFHSGTAQARNLEDGSGVVVAIDLPLAAPVPSQPAKEMS